MVIRRVILYVFVSSFFFLEDHLINCRNFSNQANVRRRAIQPENWVRRQFKEAVGLTVITYTSFFISSFSNAMFSNLGSGQ